MENDIFERFEKQIDNLLKGFERLRHDNASLREKQTILVTERDTLKEKHQVVMASIEKIIMKLQEFESGNGST